MGFVLKSLEHYYLINEIAIEHAIKYINHFEEIIIGDIVEFYKGRKFPKGIICNVHSFREFKDYYGRTQTTYAVTDIGDIPVQNLKLQNP